MILTEPRAPLSPEEEADLERLCEEYAVATASVRKALRVGNPPEQGKMQLFLEAEAQTAAIMEQIKRKLGVAD